MFKIKIEICNVKMLNVKIFQLLKKSVILATPFPNLIDSKMVKHLDIKHIYCVS